MRLFRMHSRLLSSSPLLLLTIPAVASSFETCSSTINMQKFRSVKRVMAKPHKHWVGDAFHVYPVFADLAFKEALSPLLMFDYAEPTKFNSKVGQPRGVGRHPHRG
jgi:hypothetical protein